MSTPNLHKYPKIHNAMWPGLVGKGGDGPGAEPPIDLETMLDLTANAQVDGTRFDGVDLFLSLPHTDIDSSDDDLKKLSDSVAKRNLMIGSLVAPVWPPTGGGSAMGTEDERKAFVKQVKKSCAIAKKLNDLGVRKYGVVRIDSASGPGDWAADPVGNTKKIAATFREAADVAESYGERLAAEGEICWAGMHSWKYIAELMEETNRPQTVGIQADMAHLSLYTLGYNAPEHRILPENYDWKDITVFEDAIRTMAQTLRPWIKDFHVAQNDATVKGQGSHDKTGRHCLPHDPNGKINVVKVAGIWLRDDNGALTKSTQHICWDGCMFSNETMTSPNTWRDVLSTMIAVRNAHGWD
jgi:sugar phosphate isomerase/epimerase